MNISTTYDAIVSKTSLLFPAKLRLHNPYELEDNPEVICKDSWGLKVGSANYQELDFSHLHVAREFTIILIRQFATVGNKDTAFDTVSKAMLEDQRSLLRLVYSPDELGIEGVIDQITIESISGVEFLKTGQNKYLFCEITFRITLSDLVI